MVRSGFVIFQPLTSPSRRSQIRFRSNRGRDPTWQSMGVIPALRNATIDDHQDFIAFGGYRYLIEEELDSDRTCSYTATYAPPLNVYVGTDLGAHLGRSPSDCSSICYFRSLLIPSRRHKIFVDVSSQHTSTQAQGLVYLIRPPEKEHSDIRREAQRYVQGSLVTTLVASTEAAGNYNRDLF
ncbi:hypothetical protein AB1N83_009232 [Pleurotus pulmonarius]